MEPPAARSRGRPRKRRRKDEENDGKSVSEVKLQAVGTRAIALVGRFVLKEFPRNGVFLGKVVYYDCGLYRVNYEDGDCEDLDSAEVRAILVNESDFDDNLVRRRGELEKLVSQISSDKVADTSEKGSADANKEESVSDQRVSCEFNGGVSIENGEEEDAEVDSDSSSDSGVGLREGDAEWPPLPPPLQLPPSSGTIGVPEPYVSHLFSVYGFLRSFSIRLFLFPFTLDEFVGSLNCNVSNMVFDAIHVSLMRVLRRHLETQSSEGSEIASLCLRYNDWSLLDTLTWPAFLIQYLVVNGYTEGPEWKGFYDEVFSGEYYLLPVSRKLKILQILCDDVLESEEVKAEMNLRKEAEFGVDYDAEDILPVEIGQRRALPKYTKTYVSEDKEALKFVSTSNAMNQHGSSISSFSDMETSEDGEVDRNGDECRLCGMDGTLLCCDGCPSAYHSRCIGVTKMSIPEGPWYCPECKVNMARPTITKGTSLRGAEIFGNDLYGQLFLGTCDHLLVMNIDNNEFCLKYYNQNDIPKVLQLLYGSLQHRPIYHGICMAVLQYWGVPESFLTLSVSTAANIKEETKFSSSVFSPVGEENNKPVSLVKGENPLNAMGLIHGDSVVPFLDAPLVTSQSPAPEISCHASSIECSMVDIKLAGEDIRTESVISAASDSISVSYQPDMNYQYSIDRSISDPAKYSLVEHQHNNHGLTNHMGLPLNFSLQTKESSQPGFGKCEHKDIDDVVYMGFSYKPLSYINYYMHGDFAASAAAKFAVLSSEESRSDGHVSDKRRKTASGNTYLQAKAFSLAASRFFWPSSEKKLVEVPRERCGWCFSCKASVTSKRGCMLNHAALSVTKSALKILAGFSPVRSGEGVLPSIATYIIYMEECLRGLIVGPFLSASYRKQWRKQVEQATTLGAIKSLLLKLEENVRMIAFCGDWFKLMDDWLVETSTSQSATSTLATAQKRAPSGKRYKKRSAVDNATDDGCHESFVWWRGGKFSKFIFQKAVLPKFMVKKAARQGGLKKISRIVYADDSEIPKRSRQLVWRVAVQMSRNAPQLALQVRYLDFYLRWSDLVRPEQNIQDGKGQETEASIFRNANICDKKLVEGKCCYGIAFGSQKHLPSRVMKNVNEIEQAPEGKEKYWFSETHIPLYLIKEYEETNVRVLSDGEHMSITSQLHKKRYKATCTDIFHYLTCKRDNLDLFSCSVCQMGVSIRDFRTAYKCNACQGYCHEGCSMSSTVSTNELEYLTTCKQCYHAKLLAQKETSKESPTSPLLLQGRENSSATVLRGPRPLKSAKTKANHPEMKQITHVKTLKIKGPKPKLYGQALTSSRTKENHPDVEQVSSDSTSAMKSRNKNLSWGIIWKKKNNEVEDINFRVNNILLKGGSGMPELQPVCNICRKPYRSDLMYIRCESCANWYHAEAVELEESKILSVVGFKCCKCRRIKSPVCPYSELKTKGQEGKKSHTRASKKEHPGADSDSGTCSEMKECEPATPVLSAEDDPLLFSLADVELITEPKLDADVEWNSVSGAGPQKLPVRRHVKREGHGDGSFGGMPLHSEFSTYVEPDNLYNPAEVSSSLEYDAAVHFNSNVLNNSESVNFEYTDFEPHTYFSMTELLEADDSYQFEGVDVPEDLSGCLGNSSVSVPEECGGVSLVNESEPAMPFENSVYTCWICSQMEPAPDLCCQYCGILIHNHCSPWVESPSGVGNWRCGNCREWQ